MTAFKLLLKYLDEIVCGTALTIMITLVIVNVFSRYLLNYSITWAEEVATICFVWCVFTGASATYKHKFDMGIDFFVNKAPKRFAYFVTLFSSLILLVINGYIFVMAIMFTKIAWEKPTAVLGVSSAVFNTALVVGFGLVTFYTVRFLYRDYVDWRQQEQCQ